MGRKRFTAEQIINLLRKAEVLMNQGAKSREVCRKLEISQQTYCRWRKEYGGMRVEQAKRLKQHACFDCLYNCSIHPMSHYRTPAGRLCFPSYCY